MLEIELLTTPDEVAMQSKSEDNEVAVRILKFEEHNCTKGNKTLQILTLALLNAKFNRNTTYRVRS